MSRKRRLLFWGFLLAFLAAFTWGASVVGRATAGYFYVKSQPRAGAATSWTPIRASAWHPSREASAPRSPREGSTRRILVRRATGGLPEMASQPAISAFVYPEILRVCRENGTRMVVVVLEAAGKHNQAESDLALPPDVLVVDTKPGLYARLPSADAAAYLRAYGIWSGNRLIDEHPNPEAQAIIAEQVLAALSR